MQGLAPAGFTNAPSYLGPVRGSTSSQSSYTNGVVRESPRLNGIGFRGGICYASGQTQTIPRGSQSATKVKEKAGPKLDDAGPVFPPRYDGGGGGGGGGGGSSSSGGFFLFGMLLLLSFLKDLEKKWIAGRADRPDEIDKELQG